VAINKKAHLISKQRTTKAGKWAYQNRQKLYYPRGSSASAIATRIATTTSSKTQNAKRRKTSHKGQAVGWLIEGLAPMGERPWHWVEEESDWVVADYESWAR
jgi:hypothetical protein